MQIPEWLSIVETGTFMAVLITLAYNRLVSWKKFNERTSKLEISFDQYQKDQAIFMKETREMFAAYLKTCEICRLKVQEHHESDDRHVTPDLRAQISSMAKNIDTIMQHLIGGGK